MLRAFLLIIFLAASVCGPGTWTGAPATARAAKNRHGEGVLPCQDRRPIYFIENRGQVDSAVKYYARSGIQTVYLTETGMVFDMVRPRQDHASRGGNITGEALERMVFTMGFEGANTGLKVRGIDRQEATVNYFKGADRRKWHTRIPTFKGVAYEGIYPGIDLKVYGKGDALEYDFVVKPGADPNRVHLFYDGINKLRVNRAGDLILETAFGELKETRPHVYQVINGKKVEVEGEFDSSPKPETRKSRIGYGFQIAPHNASYPLIIDPTLTYSTFLGGSNKEEGWGIAVDSSGNAYVSGYTASADFPTGNVYQPNYGGGEWDAFITKFNSAGNTVAFSTYLGGSSNDCGLAIAIDGSGDAYVSGYTESTDFPTTQGAYDISHNGGPDVFVTKLSADGDTLSYSTYLGGSDETVHGDVGLRIAVDSSGCAYVTGRTFSTDFPTRAGAFQKDKNNGTTTSDIFITKFNSAGSDLVYSTYLGGSATDRGRGIAVDDSGNAYIAGFTDSIDFPTKDPPYQGSNKGNQDAILAKLNADGSALIYSTYFGGTDNDGAWGLAIDGSGNAYIAGYTNSTDFPTTTDAYQENYGGGNRDGFVAKFNSDASDLTYSTYLGGAGDELCFDVSQKGTAPYVVGKTDSLDFPTENPYHGSNSGGLDVFITKFNASGETLSYSTYLGGESDDAGVRIAVDSSGNVFATGVASDGFPVVDPYQEKFGGTYDAFVLKYYGESATLVELVSFTANGRGDHVLLEWETASEIDNAGFHLWWSNAEDEEYARLTDYLIPAEGGATWGAAYCYEDYDVEPGRTYYYKLEDIDYDGISGFHGPVSVGDGSQSLPAVSLAGSEVGSQNTDLPATLSLARRAGDGREEVEKIRRLEDEGRPGEIRCDKLNAKCCDSVNLTRQAVVNEFHPSTIVPIYGAGRAGRSEVGGQRSEGIVNLQFTPPATFEWDSRGFERFRLQFSRAADFETGVITLPLSDGDDRWITENIYTPCENEWQEILRAGRTFYWRVYGENGSDSSASGAAGPINAR